jgi:hypothetical protein
MNDQSSVFELKFLFIKMGFNVTQSAADFDVSFVVEDQIVDDLISVKVHFSVGWEAQSAVLEFDLFDRLNTEFLRDFFDVELIGYVENVCDFFINFVLFDDGYSSVVAEVHGDGVEVWECGFEFLKREWVLDFACAEIEFESVRLESGR